jgi:hypothetical protein
VVTAALVLGWFALNVSLLWAMAFVSQRLLHQFKQKYPDVAEKEIPNIFEGIRHPEQFLYFYRQRAAEVLKDDEMLLKLRRQLFVLTWLALAVPIPSMIALATIIRILR